VQLAYLDESKTQTAYFITALCVADQNAIALATSLNDVIEWAGDTYGGVRGSAELHAVDLVGGHNDWSKFRPQHRIAHRVAIYERAVAAIAEYPVRAYIRGADDATYQQRYGNGDVHGTVLPWVLERVQEDAVQSNDVALVIADELHHRDRYRRAVRGYQQFGTSGWRPAVLDRIADTLHFAPSSASRLLQAADLVSYAHTQTKRTHADPRSKAAWDRIWNTLRPVIREASCWPA
jgi:hypothetical protein